MSSAEDGANVASGARPARRTAPLTGRDKTELRALLQEKVLEHTTLLRRHQMQNGVAPTDAQPIIDEYDPVVCMALIAVDRRTPIDLAKSSHAEVAKYVRPQLKSIEVTSDTETNELMRQRNELAARLFGAVDQIPAGQGGDGPQPKSALDAARGGAKS